MTAAETFFNGDQAWAFTEEATGTGTNGTRVASPSRYTYLVLPGQTTERFSVIRSYKPAAQGKGLGFAGWLAIDSEPDKFGEATILQFPQSAANGQQLDSLDTFTSNVTRDPVLSGLIGVRSAQVRRGDTLVVPVGKGLLYVQPLYLDNPGDSLPTLWQVVVSFGDGHVFEGTTFAAALQAAFDGGGGDDGTGNGAPSTDSIPELVLLADTELKAWRAAVAAGNDTAAATHFKKMADAIAAAKALSDASTPGATPPTGTTTTAHGDDDQRRRPWTPRATRLDDALEHPLRFELGAGRVALREAVGTHAAQDRVGLRELHVAVVDDLELVARRVAHPQRARPRDVEPGREQLGAQRLLVVDDEPDVPAVVGSRRRADREGDELVAEVDPRHRRAPAAHRHLEVGAVPLERLVDVAHDERDVVDADRTDHGRSSRSPCVAGSVPAGFGGSGARESSRSRGAERTMPTSRAHTRATTPTTAS